MFAVYIFYQIVQGPKNTNKKKMIFVADKHTDSSISG